MREANNSLAGMRSASKSALQLSVGGITCSFTSLNGDFLPVLAQRYRGFESCGQAKYELMVDVRPLSYFVEKGLMTADPALPKIEVRARNGTLIVPRSKLPFQLVLDTATGRGLVAIHPSQTSFDNFLRVFYSLVLAKEGGILLHSCAVAHGGAGSVFFGVSGSEESIVAGLSGSKRALADELAVIRPWKSEFHVFATPFGREQAPACRDAHVPLRNLYLLRKDFGTRISDMSALAAVQELYRCLFFFGQPVFLLEKAFETCCLLSQQLPVRELHFAPDSSLWECLERDGQDNASWEEVCGHRQPN